MPTLVGVTLCILKVSALRWQTEKVSVQTVIMQKIIFRKKNNFLKRIAISSV